MGGFLGTWIVFFINNNSNNLCLIQCFKIFHTEGFFTGLSSALFPVRKGGGGYITREIYLFDVSTEHGFIKISGKHCMKNLSLYVSLL